MGQTISSSITPPPLTLQDCFVDGQIDISRYLYYRRRSDDIILSCVERRKRLRRRRMRHSTQMIINTYERAKRSIKRHALFVRDSNGELRELRPEDTLWYLLYVANPPRTLSMKKLFRNRFRIPYHQYLYICEDIQEHPLFAQWTRSDCTGVKSSDLRLMLLGFLRYIGRGWTLDDVSEANGISREVNRIFLKTFIKYGSTVLYRKWVLEPTRETHVSNQEQLFRAAGFNGCIGSVDATHVPMLSCPHWASNIHKGFKLHIPARSYNITVDHS